MLSDSTSRRRQTANPLNGESKGSTHLLSDVAARPRFILKCLTAELQVTVVHGHIRANPHVAPGALRVIVGVAALV